MFSSQRNIHTVGYEMFFDNVPSLAKVFQQTVEPHKVCTGREKEEWKEILYSKLKALIYFIEIHVNFASIWYTLVHIHLA